MQPVADLVNPRLNELQGVPVAEPGREPLRRGLHSQELDGTRRDQCAHSYVRRERLCEAAEVPLGERADERAAEVNS